MAKRVRKEKKELNFKGIAYLLIVIAALYLIVTNIGALLIGGVLTIVLVLVILIVAAYFMIPRLGIAGLAVIFGRGK